MARGLYLCSREWKILHSYLHVFYEIINVNILKMGSELKSF